MEDEKELDSTDNEVGQVAWMEQLKEYFNVVKEEGKNVRVQCKRCLPKQTILSTSKISPANLLKHVEVRFFLMLTICFLINYRFFRNEIMPEWDAMNYQWEDTNARSFPTPGEWI
jgi:hypothetical protein